MIKHMKFIPACGLGLLLAAGMRLRAEPKAVQAIEGESIEIVAKKLVELAAHRDYVALRSVLRQANHGGETNLAEMIRRSGMWTNHLSRIESQTRHGARLNYHDPENRCHFQVILEKVNDRWVVNEIAFCR